MDTIKRQAYDDIFNQMVEIIEIYHRKGASYKSLRKYFFKNVDNINELIEDIKSKSINLFANEKEYIEYVKNILSDILQDKESAEKDKSCNMKNLKKFENYLFEKSEFKIPSMIFYQDPGHGWLKVPMKYIKELSIENDISSYSYKLGEFVYLEEDSDVSAFINALFKKTGLPEEDKPRFMNEFKNKVKTQHTNNYSKIRSYPHYKVYTKEDTDRFEKIKSAMLDMGRWSSAAIKKIKRAGEDDLEYWNKIYNLDI